MKRYSVCVVVLASLAVTQCAEGPGKIIATFHKCNEKHPIASADLQKVKNHQVPSSDNAKCLMACMLREGQMLKDGKYIKENAMLMADAMNKDNPEMAEKTRQVIEMCAKEVHENPDNECEMAFEITTCSAKHAEELGLKPPKFTM